MALYVALCLLLRGLIWGAPLPLSSDPAELIGKGSVPVVLTGRLLRDARIFDGGCSALIAVEHIDGQRRRGRTELLLRPCLDPPLQGWRLRVVGRLISPVSGPHPRLPGSAERLARLGSWSQLRANEVMVLQRPWTPIADRRRSIAQMFEAVAGSRRGGLLAALVLGGTQVDLPADLREAFRVAGLSHALAASGFHLSVLLGFALWLGRWLKLRSRVSIAIPALVIFPLLAGAQPSVMRAVLMGSATLLIGESGERSRAFGVFTLTLIVMLLIHPAWANAIGFQLSAAATAGLILTAPLLESALVDRGPKCLARLAPLVSVPCAAILWTLPLQLLHFGSTSLYALPANLLAAPLLGPLTLGAMALALLAVVLPLSVIQLLAWPLQLLAALLIALVQSISGWPAARLLTGYPHPAVVMLMALGFLPWLLGMKAPLRRSACLPLLAAVMLQFAGLLSDGVTAARQGHRRWLLARHRGRGALLSMRGDPRSCMVAQQLANAHGLGRLDWIMLLEPASEEALRCWTSLGRYLEAPDQGRFPLTMGQTLLSDGLSLQLLSERGMPMLLRVGSQRWRLLPRQQSLLEFQRIHATASFISWTGSWLGFRPTAAERAWLRGTRDGSGSIGL